MNIACFRDLLAIAHIDPVCDLIPKPKEGVGE